MLIMRRRFCRSGWRGWRSVVTRPFLNYSNFCNMSVSFDRFLLLNCRFLKFPCTSPGELSDKSRFNRLNEVRFGLRERSYCDTPCRAVSVACDIVLVISATSNSRAFLLSDFRCSCKLVLFDFYRVFRVGVTSTFRLVGVSNKNMFRLLAILLYSK
jgi:hypothetical protein